MKFARSQAEAFLARNKLRHADYSIEERPPQ